MERYQIVTEGQSHVLLLQALLGISPDHPQITFMAAGGWSGADSYARTVLIQDEANVALVVSADTTRSDEAESRRCFLQHSLGDVTLHKKFCVLVIEPQIEALLFQERSLVEQLVGKRISDAEWKRAASKPREVLTEALRPLAVQEAMETRLSRIDFASLAHNPLMQELKNFLPRARKKVLVAR